MICIAWKANPELSSCRGPEAIVLELCASFCTRMHGCHYDGMWHDVEPLNSLNNIVVVTS